MRYFAHILTGERDNVPPVIIVFDEENRVLVEYLLSAEDTLRSALDNLRDRGWRILTDPSQDYTTVDVGYDIIEVEPTQQYA